MDLEDLNPQQRVAVEHEGGPLLIFAGAGSGKTRVITHRIAHLIHQRGVHASRILAVTFTNKAAEEMKTRLEKLLGERARGLWVGTFHAICGRILRESGAVAGVPPNFVIYDEHDQVDAMRQVLRALDLDEKQFPPRQFLYAISRAKERLIFPEEFEQKAFEYFDRLVARAYPKYQEVLKQANALDFDDMLLEAIRLFREHPDVLERYQDRFLHILVDEYQDVNYAQYLLVQRLAAKHRNLCCVGDDDQSIYSFRGAEVDLILRFPDDYPDATIVTLERNYRSTQLILDAAFHVVRQNRFRASKRLWTERSEGLPVTLTRVEDEIAEARLVVEYIQRMVMRGERRYRDFAVLYRTNAQSRAFEEQCLYYRVPHRIVGALRFYDRKEIKDLLAYLRLLVNPQDIVSLRRVINTPPRGIGAQTFLQIEQYAMKNGISLWEAMVDETFLEQLTPRVSKALRAFVKLIQDLQTYGDSEGVANLVRQLLEKSGYLDWLRAENTEESRDRQENLQELVNVATQFEGQSEDKSLLAFLQQTALVSDMDMLATGGDQVLLMTLHTAKGLEFPVVFLVGLEEGLLPHARCDTPDQVEEERRLCYVGMTRAKDELHLLYTNVRRIFGYPRWTQPSRFLKSLPEDATVPLPSLLFAPVAKEPSKAEKKERENGRKGEWEKGRVGERESGRKEEKETVVYLPGQKVRHPKFGMGVVVKSESNAQGDRYVTIMFPGAVGTKTFLASAASLEML